MESKIIREIQEYWEGFNEISEEEYMFALKSALNNGDKYRYFKKNYTYCIDPEKHITKYYRRKK